MRPAPAPPREDQRLDSVRSLGVLDAPEEAAFDEIVRLATLACGTPAGAVGLLDHDRVWYQAHLGLPARSCPRDGSFTSWVVLGERPLVVPDAALDERFADGLPGLLQPAPRFLAGAPLIDSEGYALGALCVFGPDPRQAEAVQVEALAILARQVTAHLELRRTTRRQEQAHGELSRTLFELADREARLAAVLDTAVEGILTIDGEGQVQSYNRAAERIFGWAAAEVLGRNVSMLMPEPDHSRHDGYLRRYQETGTPRIMGAGREVRGRHKDGGVFPLYLAVSEVRPCAQGRLFTGIVRDLSELHEAERLKREFVSIVSHELRTPLTSIRGALGLLEGGAVGPLGVAGHELVTIARTNADRLIRLVGDILDLEKIEAGRIELSLHPLLAGEVVSAALAGVQALADEALVPLSADAGDEVRLLGDRDRLIQVLTNLVANAVKFSPRGAPVRVTVRGALEHVRFEVADQGPGIPDDKRGLLFQRFQQLDPSDRRSKGGTGLGLAIAKALVEQHEGRIGVDCPGVGSQFWFEVPRGGPTRRERKP